MKARQYWSWVDGGYSEDSAISASSGAFLHGYGAFETIYSVSKEVHYLPEHYARLSEAAQYYRLPLEYSLAQIDEVISELLDRNSLEQARIRLTLTAAHTDYSAPQISSHLTITASPYERSEQSVSLVTAPASQFDCPLSTRKSTSYASYLVAKQYAQTKGVDDTLLLDHTGNLIESSSSNIFLARNGIWQTPDLTSAGLAGIQRDKVLLALDELKIPCSIEPLQDYRADFAFICNSLIGLQFVTRINDYHFPRDSASCSAQVQAIRRHLDSQ